MARVKQLFCKPCVAYLHLTQRLRRIKRSDFHIPHDEQKIPEQRKLVIEADFTFPETSNASDNSTVAPFFNHMRLNLPNGFPTVRFRLTATMDFVGEIEEKFEYVLDTDLQGKEVTKLVPRADRNQIQVHYLPNFKESHLIILHIAPMLF